MAHALEAHGAIPHCEACAARAVEAERAASAGLLTRSRAALVRWFDTLNGTPVRDISGGDMGSIRRLAEA
jgi:hypothetical protein